MTVPDEAVEAAARAMLDAMYDDKTLKVDDEDRGIARATLEAAAPLIAAQAWDEGSWVAQSWKLPREQNPYRSGT